MLTTGAKEPSHTLPAQGDVTHADWKTAFATWVVTYARKRNGLRALGGGDLLGEYLGHERGFW